MNEIVAIDVETTGLSPLRGHRIIEIAAVRIAQTELAEEFHSLINAGRPIPEAARRIHGISEKILRDQPSPSVVLERFRKFIGNCTLVAHNAPFDCAFLRNEYDRLGWELTNNVHCTLELSRRILPGLRDYKLTTVFRYLFPDDNESLKLHRALSDARITAKIWLKTYNMAAVTGNISTQIV